MYCSNCGNKLEEGLDKCPNCGEVVNVSISLKGSKKITILGIISLIVIVGLVLFTLLVKGSTNKAPRVSKAEIQQNNQAYLDYMLDIDTYALSDDNSRFCVYDFNNDGLNEVLLDIHENDYNTLYVLYRYKDDVLKLVEETDGDFEFYPQGRLFYIMRNGLFSYYIDFDHTDVNWICKEIEGYYDGYSNKYLLGNHEVNEDEYDAYVEELVRDKDVMYSEDFKWYDFTRKNIKEVLETK